MDQLFIVVPKQSKISIGGIDANNALITIQPPSPEQILPPMSMSAENNGSAHIASLDCYWGFRSPGYAVCLIGGTTNTTQFQYNQPY